VRIAVLGPLEIHGDGVAPAEVAGARLRALTILLALTPGQVVSTGTLIDGVWAGEPPTGSNNALQALVSRLRRAAPGLPVESHPQRVPVGPAGRRGGRLAVRAAGPGRSGRAER
jgi:DNA-binding SARP family transcriptional activator